MSVANLLSELDVLASFADVSTESDPSKAFVHPEIMEANGGGGAGGLP